MHALKLDYRRQSSWQQRAGLVSLLLVGLAMGYQGWHYRQLTLAVDADKAEVDQLAEQLRPTRHGLGAPQGNQIEAEMHHAREVLLRLGLSWEALFSAVEDSTNDEVALLEIAPEPEREQVRITGEAKTYPAVLDYVRRLEKSAPLSGVHLQSHQIQTQDPERPVRFVLGAAWRVRQ